jgi:hypothetical protein
MSLLEVLLAMVIFAVGLLGVLGMFSLSEEGIESGHKTTLAVGLAQEKMEEKWGATFSRLLWDDLDGDGLPETMMSDDGLHGDEAAGDGTYSNEDEGESGVLRRWSVTRPPLPSDLTLIEVRTSWEDKQGRVHAFQLRALRAER